MEPSKEQFYLRRIAELEKQVAELLAQVAKLTEEVARLSKNSSNSSKPPSSDIVKPPDIAYLFMWQKVRQFPPRCQPTNPTSFEVLLYLQVPISGPRYYSE